MAKLFAAFLVLASVAATSVASAEETEIDRCGDNPITILVQKNKKWQVCYFERMDVKMACTAYKTEGAARAAYNKSCSQ